MSMTCILQLSKIQVLSHTFFNRGCIRKFSLTNIRTRYAEIFLHEKITNIKNSRIYIYLVSYICTYVGIYILYIYITYILSVPRFQN